MAQFLALCAGILIVSAILFFADAFTALPSKNWWQESLLVPHFSIYIQWFFEYFEKLVQLSYSRVNYEEVCACAGRVVGIVGNQPVNQALYDGLTMLQHRGQDAAGIMTMTGRTLRLRKSNGLVPRCLSYPTHAALLSGNIGIGPRAFYPTAGKQ